MPDLTTEAKRFGPTPRKTAQLHQRVSPALLELLKDVSVESGLTHSDIVEIAVRKFARDLRSGTLELTTDDILDRPATTKLAAA